MPCTPIAESASRTSSSLKGLMIAVTSFMRVSSGRRMGGRPVGSERFSDRKDDGVAAGISDAGTARVGEAIDLSSSAVALRVGSDIRGAEHPAAHVLRHAELPVVVVAVGHVLEFEVAVVPDDPPAAAEVVVEREVEVIRPLGVLAVGALGAEVIVERVEPLRREELPAAAYVHFLVID